VLVPVPMRWWEGGETLLGHTLVRCITTLRRAVPPAGQRTCT